MIDHAPTLHERLALFGRAVVIISFVWIIGGTLDGADPQEIIAVPLVVAAWAFGIFILTCVKWAAAPRGRDRPPRRLQLTALDIAANRSVQRALFLRGPLYERDWRTHEVAFSDLDTAATQNVVGGRVMKKEIR
jgi:hypothetical protein